MTPRKAAQAAKRTTRGDSEWEAARKLNEAKHPHSYGGRRVEALVLQSHYKWLTRGRFVEVDGVKEYEKPEPYVVGQNVLKQSARRKVKRARQEAHPSRRGASLERRRIQDDLKCQQRIIAELAHRQVKHNARHREEQ